MEQGRGGGEGEGEVEMEEIEGEGELSPLHVGGPLTVTDANLCLGRLLPE